MIVNEIFTSIDGEVNRWGQGILTTFVRLQGCNLRCDYCDTPDALEFADLIHDVSIAEVITEIANKECKKVTITGGEPMAQHDFFELLDLLMRYEYWVSIETNGTYLIPIPYLNDERLSWVVDYKWEYQERMRMNWTALSENDWIKFLVNEDNVMGIFSKIKEMRKEGVSARIAVSDVSSPEAIHVNHVWLMNLLIKERMFDVSLNVQLHKLIGIA